MIASLLPALPLMPRLPRGAAALLAAAGLMALGGLGLWQSARTVERLVSTAASAAAAARDAHWRGEIARVNALHEAERAAQAAAALRAEADAAAAQSAILSNLKSLETRNATLPDGGRCGLDRARVRLLQQHR
jgi:hypothetical protein